MKAILVTGGAGFIGSNLCDGLLARGETVVAYDNFDPYYAPKRKRQNLEDAEKNPNFTLIEGDVLDGGKLLDVVKDCEIGQIVHLAACAGVRPSLLDPVKYQRVNVCGTTEVLEAARKSGISTVVMASSSSVYGANEKTPFHEDDPVLSPISPYAASKRASEIAASVHAHLYKMDILAHRFFTVYGPRQRPDMAISLFVDKIRRGEPIDMYGDGSTRRDYTFVGDIVSGLISSLEHAPGLGFQIFNLGNAQTVTLAEMIATIGRAVGRDACVHPMPEQPGDVKVTSANVEKAKKLLGYAPKTTLAEGVQKYVAWLEKLEKNQTGARHAAA